MGYNATPARILYLPESYILCSIFVDVVFIVVYCLVFYRAFHVPVSTEAVSGPGGTSAPPLSQSRDNSVWIGNMYKK